MVLSRIYTERKHLGAIKKILSDCAVDGYTLFEGSGVYDGGKEEPCLVIEIAELSPRNLREICERIGKENDQEYVLAVTHPDTKNQYFYNRELKFRRSFFRERERERGDDT